MTRRLALGAALALFVLWLAATVVPWALLMLVLSIFVRGTRLYWPTMGGCAWRSGVRV
jgi:hypothetical protein